MSLIINNNSMANTAARNLNNAYNQLTKSTEKLSSGMRINSAADDAAGLAVREMMRAQTTTLNQGVRNANDAISMIQTADGALSVIDEKLIRMNELAEQAATGTYTDEQRAIIDQEYQTMAAEITRISDSTDFNGQSLLNGALEEGSTYEDSNGEVQDGKSMTVHFGTGNDADEDKYSIEIEDVSAEALGIGSESLDYKINDDGLATTQDGKAIYENEDGEIYIDGSDPTMDATKIAAQGYTQVQLKEKVVADPADEATAKSEIVTRAEGTIATAVGKTTGATAADTALDIDGASLNTSLDANGKLVYSVGGTANTKAQKDTGTLLVDDKAMYATIDADGTVSINKSADATVPTAGYGVTVGADGALTVNIAGDDKKLLTSTAADGSAKYFIEDESADIPADAAVMNIAQDAVDQGFEVAADGSATVGTVTVQDNGTNYALTGTGSALTGTVADTSFTMSVAMVDSTKVDSFEKELGKTSEYAGSSIATQEGAQAALDAIGKAIEQKDKNRANLGAYENRLEATISNLEIQSENLSAAESRISDVDVATEMTEYTLRQTISQAATSMLAQANTLPQNALSLIG
ncbi:flagellin N-terminal helical domain-containing protein [Halodesulfovibrio spirochaetisodalis]|uniref:flagellin N-terminal helical domain-containing protein n=1 Tax=Halodesulfovibrio spirochaetisodalis TaxID=1560234 RepID=UPI0009EF0834